MEAEVKRYVIIQSFQIKLQSLLVHVALLIYWLIYMIQFLDTICYLMLIVIFQGMNQGDLGLNM